MRLMNVRRVFVVYASGEAKLSELLEPAGFSVSLPCQCHLSLPSAEWWAVLRVGLGTS